MGDSNEEDNESGDIPMCFSKGYGQKRVAIQIDNVSKLNSDIPFSLRNLTGKGDSLFLGLYSFELAVILRHISMGECNTVLNACTLYRHLE